MSMPRHTVTGFDTDLAVLKDHITTMGRLVDRAFGDAVEALRTGNTDTAARIIGQDEEVDELESETEEEAVQIIARRQPLAIDLREIMAAVRIANELERIGDLSKNIAKRARAVGGEALPEDLANRITEMGGLAQTQLRAVLEAYANKNAGEAIAIREKDGEIDLLNTAFFKDSIDYIAGTYKDVVGITHLLFCAKNIERVGDHVTNISENVYFIATGAAPAQERKKLDTSSSVDVIGEKKS
jgi:phosphate transport system protein